MPVALDPKARYPVVLESDQDKPEDHRPTFWFRYLTKGELERWDEWRKAKRQKILEALNMKLASCLSGWENMVHPTDGPMPFGPGSTPHDICNPAELIELQDAVITANTLGTLEKKGSGSPSPISSGNRAGTATRRRAKGSRRRRKSR